MPWYTYLFIVLALLAFVLGTHYAGTPLRFTRSLLMAGFWAGLAYWTGWMP